MYLELLGFVLVGKLIIYLAQQFFFANFGEVKFFSKLFSCDLCLGVWVYSILNFFFGINLLEQVFYIWIVSEILSGAVISFLMHLISIGWSSKYQEIIID